MQGIAAQVHGFPQRVEPQPRECGHGWWSGRRLARREFEKHLGRGDEQLADDDRQPWVASESAPGGGGGGKQLPAGTREGPWRRAGKVALPGRALGKSAPKTGIAASPALRSPDGGETLPRCQPLCLSFFSSWASSAGWWWRRGNGFRRCPPSPTICAVVVLAPMWAVEDFPARAPAAFPRLGAAQRAADADAAQSNSTGRCTARACCARRRCWPAWPWRPARPRSRTPARLEWTRSSALGWLAGMMTVAALGRLGSRIVVYWRAAQWFDPDATQPGRLVSARDVLAVGESRVPRPRSRARRGARKGHLLSVGEVLQRRHGDHGERNFPWEWPTAPRPSGTNAPRASLLRALRASVAKFSAYFFRSICAKALWLWMDSKFSASTRYHLMSGCASAFSATARTRSSTNTGFS